MDPVVLRRRAMSGHLNFILKGSKQAGLGNIKRPDLLIFDSGDTSFVDGFLNRIGGYRRTSIYSRRNTRRIYSKGTHCG